MYLKHIEIVNFRGLEKMNINFREGINLLIADNGVGKTSILEAITVGLGTCFRDIPVASSRNIRIEDIRRELKTVKGKPIRINHTPVQIDCEMDIDGTLYKWTRIQEDDSSNSRTMTKFERNHPKISDYFRISANEGKPLPVLNYQSIYHGSQSRRSDFGRSLKKLNDRRCGYTGCLDSALDNKFITTWGVENKWQDSSHYEVFANTVSRAMKFLGDLQELPKIECSVDFEGFAYGEGDSRLPISMLSSGYQAVLWMVMDIAFRALLLNPEMTKIEETSGIVLIDEIDKHLHPKWQWNVLETLHTIFPKVQFIIATHAPIVIASCKEANLLRIEGQEAKELDNVYGYGIEDVAEFTQGSFGVEPKVKMLYRDFQDAYCKGDIHAAALLVLSLKSQYPKSSESAKAETKIRLMVRKNPDSVSEEVKEKLFGKG